MCTICISKAGVRAPSPEEMQFMFKWNPDGAGYMFVRGGRVIIRKGFTTLAEYVCALKKEGFTDEDVVVYHFRESTQAGDPNMTHPFALTSNLARMKRLEDCCLIGVAHNGIIHCTTDQSNRHYSDTALFIKHYIRPRIRSRADLHNQALLDEIALLAEDSSPMKSWFAFLDASGEVTTIGDYINHDGLLFSNERYSPTFVKEKKPDV